MIKYCKNCGTEIKHKKEWSNKTFNNIQFCCRDCYIKHRIGIHKVIVKCLNCGKDIITIPSRKRKYCCIKCQMKYEYDNNIRNKYEITKNANEHIKKYGQPKLKGRILSEEHKDKIRNNPILKGRIGSKNPMFGKTPWNKMFPTKKWWEETNFIRLRKECLERDNYKCVECGISNTKKDLYCDHIIPYRICKEHKLDNLQMLCGSCHSKKTVKDVKLMKNMNML